MARLDVTSEIKQTSAPAAGSRPTAVPGRFQAVQDLFGKLFNGVAASPDVVLAGGVSLHRGSSPRATIILMHSGVIRELLMTGSDIGVAEAYIRGEISVDGDLESAIDALAVARRIRTPREWFEIVRIASRISTAPQAADRSNRADAPRRQAARLTGRRHSRERDRAAVEYHYNVSNEFYSLWLDGNMTYSCAYFRSPSDSLDAAQLQKYDLIARKLRVGAGERVLDIGCGWGGLIRFLAREYGAQAVGITLSSRQAEYARQRVAREGLEKACAVELLDYRDLSTLGAFDKIASVGMVEHVGSGNLAAYFNSAHGVLAPGGLFLNHGIVSQTPVPTGLRGVIARIVPARSGFIERYVFPESDLLRLDVASAAAERAGFELLDAENLRPHYQRTLQHWVRRLEDNQTEARRIVGDETYNTWRLYMAGSAQGFGSGRLGVVQMLLAKREADGSHRAPHTRDDIYAST
ncbi:MAG TPA: cyclopropane-fatty-acyl-phospholipid synthase family protein [Candidatus Eremiobacteraceae bacterium]